MAWEIGVISGPRRRRDVSAAASPSVGDEQSAPGAEHWIVAYYIIQCLRRKTPSENNN